MQIEPSKIEGVHTIRSVVHRDHRGSFHRTVDLDLFAAAGLPTHWPQQNQSLSYRGVVRGMHVRLGAGEGKIVRVVNGAIDDVIVDVRLDSNTFLQQDRFRLDDADHVQLFLPPGVAHGYQVLSEFAIVVYMHTESYEPSDEGAFNYSDHELAIEWSVQPVVVSDRDSVAPTLDEFLRARW
jgi:dTDP-4-dehydrorhamnose 3,5-epimerase